MFVITQQRFASYRRPIYQRLLAGHAGMKGRLVFGLNSPHDDVASFTSIEDIPLFEGIVPDQYVLVNNRRIVRPALWQSGLLREVFRRDVEVVVFEGNPRSLSDWAAMILLRLFTRKRVLTWTQGITHSYSGLEGVIKRWNWRLPHGMLLYGNRARRILTEEFGHDPDRLYVIYNSLDHARHIELRETLTPEILARQRKTLFGASPEDPVLLCIGRMTRVKKVDMLLAAAAEMLCRGCPVNILLVGDGDAVEDLRRQAEELGLGQRVCFYGACYGEEENARLIGCSTLCVVPGPIGLTAIHALSFGIPVITSDHFSKHGPEFEAIIPERTGDFFRHDDVSSLAETIQKWLETDRDPEQLRQYCFAVIDKYYNPETQVEVFRAALEGRPASECPPLFPRGQT